MSPDIQELKRLAEAATAGNLDTVPNPPTEYGGKDEEGCFVCPQCDGEGAVDAVTYTNFDGVAMGVQFFGIGDAFQRYEAYFRAASPSTILALIEENKRLAKLIRVLLENEPDDLVADGGHTVLQLWRHDARAALKETTDV